MVDNIEIEKRKHNKPPDELLSCLFTFIASPSPSPSPPLSIESCNEIRKLGLRSLLHIVSQ
jgi:hypothetical protein